MKDIANLLASISALLGPVPIIITAVTSLIVSIRSRTQQIKGARLSILPGESGPTFRCRLQVKCAYEDYIDCDSHRLVSSSFWFDYSFLQQNH